jgi:8-oxo-dGTP diphosphatase
LPKRADPPPATLASVVLSVDVVAFAAPPDGLKVLLTRRAAAPFRGRPSLPGVAMLADETLLSAARRALREKAAVSDDDVGAMHVEQLATFDALFRDPRGRTISVAHLALSRTEAALGARSEWARVGDVPPGTLPFDHDDILLSAVRRLRGKLRYSDVARHLVEETFPIERLHGCYEDVLGRQLDRSNFRTKLLKIGLLEKVGKDPSAVSKKGGRPPHLYRFAAADRPRKDFL